MHIGILFSVFKKAANLGIFSAKYCPPNVICMIDPSHYDIIILLDRDIRGLSRKYPAMCYEK